MYSIELSFNGLVHDIHTHLCIYYSCIINGMDQEGYKKDGEDT